MLALASILLAGVPLTTTSRAEPSTPPAGWPEGADSLHFENLDGVILLSARLYSADRDTAGLFVLDTGAGFLALDRPLAAWLGLSDSSDEQGVQLIRPPLARLELGTRQMDRVTPILSVDAGVVRNVTDRLVLGLLGQALFRQSAIDIDYASGRLTLVPLAAERAPDAPNDDAPRAPSSPPPESGAIAARVSASRAALGGGLTPAARPLAFELVGDGKMLVRARVSDPRAPHWSTPLDLLIDTGATKTVLFSPSLDAAARHYGAWRSLHGLSAPTLFGAADAWAARVPTFEIETGTGAPLRMEQSDVAVLKSELRDLLSRATGVSIDGLLGYSFLKNYRVTIDYPHRVMWLSPAPVNWDDREFEYCHIGLQLERRDGAVRVVGVAEKSPADDAGIEAGDEVLALNGESVAKFDIVELGRRLEGKPGTAVEISLRRGVRTQHYKLVRRQLL